MLSHASSISTSAPPRRASATPPLRGERSNAANRERSEQRAEGTRLWLAPHSQCRRYWLCGVAIITEAIVCRRYTIMVAQIHHLKPRHKAPPQTPPKNPISKPHHKTPPKIIIHDPTIIAYLRHAIVCGGDSLPHTAGTHGTACVGLTIIAYLRHAARSPRHLTAPLLATATTPTTNTVTIRNRPSGWE